MHSPHLGSLRFVTVNFVSSLFENFALVSNFLKFGGWRLLFRKVLFEIMIYVIDEPTRITPAALTLIDPVLVSDSCTVLDSGILNVDGNIIDHKATYVSIRINVNLSTSSYREVWKYKNADYTTLNNLIEEFN